MTRTNLPSGRSIFPNPGDLDHINTWIFDLDNTLYSAQCRLFDQVDQRIGEYVAKYLDLEPSEARQVQKNFFYNHGSTLRGMMILHDMEPTKYLDYVHDIDLSAVEPDPFLDRALTRLPGRKLIFTSATVAHAQRVTTHLKIDHHFDSILDVVAADYQPKPHKKPYKQLLNGQNITPKNSAFFDDISRNLKPAADMGITTIWIPSSSDWAQPDEDTSHIHYVAEDLSKWLLTAVPE